MYDAHWLSFVGRYGIYVKIADKASFDGFEQIIVEYDISEMEKNFKYAWVSDFQSVKVWIAEYLKLDR